MTKGSSCRVHLMHTPSSKIKAGDNKYAQKCRQEAKAYVSDLHPVKLQAISSPIFRFPVIEMYRIKTCISSRNI